MPLTPYRARRPLRRAVISNWPSSTSVSAAARMAAG